MDRRSFQRKLPVIELALLNTHEQDYSQKSRAAFSKKGK
jgi:hypothetical protein